MWPAIFFPRECVFFPEWHSLCPDSLFKLMSLFSFIIFFFALDRITKLVRCFRCQCVVESDHN